MFKDFSDEARNRMLGYSDDVTTEGVWNTLKDFISDCLGKIRGVDITNYMHDIDGYHRRVIDIKRLTLKQINQVFDREQTLDNRYGKQLDAGFSQNNSDIKVMLSSLCQMISPSTGAITFSPENMKAFRAASESLKKSSQNVQKVEKDCLKRDEEIKMIKKDKLGRRENATLFSADPVNLATGNFIYEKTDIAIDGEIPMEFHRFYNSQDDKCGVLGKGYRHNYEIFLKEEDENVEVIMQDGSSRFFQKDKENHYVGILSALETLDVVHDDKHAIEQYIMTQIDGYRYYFNPRGMVTREEDDHQRGISYIYNEKNQLVKVENDNREFMEFSYQDDGKLCSVTTSGERIVRYEYKENQLDVVIMPNSNRYYYRYTSNGEMTEIKNAREIVTVKNEYDDQCRVVKQEFPDGSTMLYEYNENELILTERNGAKIKYIRDSEFRNTDVIYEDGTSEHYEFNDKNQKTLIKDRNGNVTRLSYDNRGNVVKAINALGQISTMTYDINNKLLTLKVNRVERIKNTYDSKGNLIASVGADGNGVSYHYDKEGRVTRVEDADHEQTSLSYDERGNIVSVVVNQTMESKYEYDEHNNVIASVDGNGNKTHYAYDEADRLIHVTNAHGDAAIYEYNEIGKVTRFVDFDGYDIRVTYNNLNKEESITDKEGNTTTFQYDKMWNVSAVTRPDGGLIRYAYNHDNRLETMIMPEGNAIRYAYDGNGNLLSETDGTDAKIQYTYDALNRRKTMMDALGYTTTYQYDANGNLVKETDALGNEKTYQYDADGNLTAETNVLGDTTCYEYTVGGKLKKVTYPNGTSDMYEYQKGVLVSSSKSTGESYAYTYDANENLICQKNGLGEEIVFTYDALNRMTAITLPTKAKRTFGYDKVGNLETIVDENGHETRYEYSPNGNLVKVVDAAGGIARYQYDAMGNLIQMVRSGQEAEDEITTYVWNKNSQLVTVTDPLGDVESYVYDMAGRMIQKEDRDGYVTNIAYDANGNVTGLRYADEKEVAYAYDALRHLQEMKDWNGVTSIVNDAMGNPLSITDYNGETVSYEWGSNGEKKKMTYPDGSGVSYEYDERGLLTYLKTSEGQTDYAYDEIGRMKEKKLPNGVVTTYQYNSIGRLSELRHLGEQVDECYCYTYDAVGNKIAATKTRSGVKEDNGQFTYGYDALNQLISVSKDGNVQREYTYDAFGNRVAKKEYGDKIIETVYRYNRNNQLLSDVTGDESRRYQYDKRGNLLQVSGDEGIIKQFTFDARNVLSEALDIKDGAERKVSYQYNGLGNRTGQIWKDSIKPDRRIRYTIDLTRQYHNMLTETVETEERLETSLYYYDNHVVGMRRAGGDAYFIHDDLGSPMSVWNENGHMEEAYAYDEFGNEFGNVIDARDRFQPLGYTGYQKEAVGDVYFAQARRYDAGVGRFVSEDRMKGDMLKPITLNMYKYCMNAPFTYIDPSGNIECFDENQSLRTDKSGINTNHMLNTLERYVGTLKNAIELGGDVLDIAYNKIRKYTTITIRGGKFFHDTTIESQFKWPRKIKSFSKFAKALGRVAPIIDVGFMGYDVWSGYQYNKNIVHASEDKIYSDIVSDLFINSAIMFVGLVPVLGDILGIVASKELDKTEENGQTVRQNLKDRIYETNWFRIHEYYYNKSRDINGGPLVIQYGPL